MLQDSDTTASLEINAQRCYRRQMVDQTHPPADEDVGDRIYPDMPNHVTAEAAFLIAVEIGLADIKAGRTVSFETVAAQFRRNHGGE